MSIFKKDIRKKMNETFRHFNYEFSWPQIVHENHLCSLTNSGVIAFPKKFKKEEVDFILNEIDIKNNSLEDEREKELLSELRNYFLFKKEECIKEGCCKISLLKHEANYLSNKIICYN